MCALATATASSALARPAAPSLSVEGATLRWTAVPETTEYQLRVIYPESAESSASYVAGLSYILPAEPGHAVEYRVRAFAPTVGAWSNRVKIQNTGEQGQPAEEEHSGGEEPAACTKYASTSGRDGNAGTAAAPFRTVDHLLHSLTAGQTGCLFSGQTFDEEVEIGAHTSSTSKEIDAVPHGVSGDPITITSTDPQEPATIARRISLLYGANWITFDHLTIKSDVPPQIEENPSPTIDSEHTSWTNDDISGGSIDICISPGGYSIYGQSVDTLIEHDRVHNCGHPVTDAELLAQGSDVWEEPLGSGLFRLNGWHAHGIYDEGEKTTVRNSYFYDNSSNGILLRGGDGALIEHNIIDANGKGVLFGNENDRNGVVAWNIITNSNSPCQEEVGLCDDYGIVTYFPGAGNVVRHNDVFGNASGNIEASEVAVEDNIEVNPRYTDAAAHDYTLLPSSRVLGYGPDTAQP